MGKNRQLSVAERADIVTLTKEGYLKRQILKNLKLSKTEIHQTTVKFRNYVSFQDSCGSGYLRVYLPKGWSPDKIDGSAFINQFKQENWVSLVAQRYSYYNADSIFLLELVSCSLFTLRSCIITSVTFDVFSHCVTGNCFV